MLEYQSISALCAAAEEAGVSLSELVLRDQAEEMELPTEVLYQRMRENLQVMRQAIQAGSMPETRSLSGLTGGDAFKMKRYAQEGGIIGGFMNRSIARALAVSEYNAAMGKVVASPTAGSCGILPGTVVSMLEEGKCTEEAAVMALFTAGAVGMVIAQQASIAGAQGGCQAECGSAAAMAAAAIVIPCIKRNVSGVSIAFTAAEMALAGIESKIPVDECIQAMKSVGDSMCSALKETALGGLAMTPTGIQYAKRIYNTAQ